MPQKIRIAIDGPAGAGKSTIAKIVAEQLLYTYIDTGAMYRALTYVALEQKIPVTEGEALGELLAGSTIELHPSEEGQRVIINGKEVTEEIRTSKVTAAVSTVAAHQQVRTLMIEKQRQLGEQPGVVMDGRDIGTSVLPHAELKIYMTASAQERALRRQRENEKRGVTSSIEELQAAIAQRDKMDMERAISPLRQAEDALRLDTTHLTIEQVATQISELAKERCSQ